MPKPIMNVADISLDPTPPTFAPTGPAVERFEARTTNGKSDHTGCATSHCPSKLKAPESIASSAITADAAPSASATINPFEFSHTKLANLWPVSKCQYQRSFLHESLRSHLRVKKWNVARIFWKTRQYPVEVGQGGAHLYAIYTHLKLSDRPFVGACPALQHGDG